MFKKIKNIKNMVVLGASVFLIFIIGSIVFLIVSNVRMSKTLDEVNNKLDEINSRIDNNVLTNY